MDPSTSLSPAELYELIGILSGVGVTGVVGFLLVRRARASRLRQIEGEEEAPALERAAPQEAEAEAEIEAEKPQAALPKQPAKEEDEPDADVLQTQRRPGATRRDTSPATRTRPVTGQVPARAPERAEPAVDRERVEEERPPAQVIPFPKPAPAPAEPEAEVVPPPKRKEASAFAPGLARTRSTGFIARLGKIFAGRKEIDPSIVAEIEKVLLTADIGVRTSQQLLDEIKDSLSRKELADPDAIWAFLRRRSTEILTLPAPPVDFGAAKPFVLLVIGVNGSGKTTTIGKLAAKLAAEGRKVLLAAGDTFRAAAAEQLEVWAGRTSSTIVRGKEGADPSSVIFEGIKKGVAEGFDVVIADTAGRLHTKTDLMQELQKVRRVVAKASPGAPHETWLVIDSTSGQNAIAQAQTFTEAMETSGIVLTKLDGTAKGGVILGIAHQLKLPVRYVGVGEKVEDLRPFDPEAFSEALFTPPDPTESGDIS
jgi:fused signal recognition particle receptor